MTKRAKIRLIFYAVTSVIIALAILGITVAVSALVLVSSPDEISGKYTVVLDDDNDKTKPIQQTIDVKYVYVDRQWYVNYSDIVDYYGFSVSGDRTYLKYNLRNNTSDTMTVNFSDNSIALNGVPIDCANPIMKADGSIYLPATIFEDYFKGIDFEVDEKEKLITITCSKTCFLTVWWFFDTLKRK